MIGLELVAGYLVAYATRKARRAGRRVDEEVDRVIDEGLGRLHEVVTEKLGEDPAIRQLEREADGGASSPRTAERVRLALEEAADTDGEFARDIAEALQRLTSLDSSGSLSAVVRQTAVADHGSTVNQAGRDLIQRPGWPGR
jgi:hypothetical protein